MGWVRVELREGVPAMWRVAQSASGATTIWWPSPWECSPWAAAVSALERRTSARRGNRMDWRIVSVNVCCGGGGDCARWTVSRPIYQLSIYTCRKTGVGP